MYKVKKVSKRNSRRGRSFRKSPRNNRMDINKFIKRHLDLKPQDPYFNVHTFKDFQLHEQLIQQIFDIGYVTPTEIQDKTIPDILEGHDLVGIAGTGTGKTAAFLIPIIQKLIEKPANNYSLIIAPTRELANQISDEFRKLTKGLKLYSTSLIGGASVHRSIKALGRINHVVIGTPGRLIDMTKRGYLSLGQFQTLVLDEFDRMLDMGFLNDIKYIHGRMTGKKQTLLFSATMEESQRSIVSGMTDSPIEVTAETGAKLPYSIEQDVVHIPGDRKKVDVLHDIINEIENQKILLFCETKRMVNKVYKNLRMASIRTDMIHGDKTQRAREKALGKFRSGEIKVLVATDVVARGIDVTDVSLVINHEVPRNYNDYLHRIGRTGRAGKTGKAITLID